MIEEIKKSLLFLADPEKAEHYLRFFKTGKGEYGEGDQFIGVIVPDQRAVAKAFFREISLSELQVLLMSPIHEYRLTSLFMLTYKFEKESDPSNKKQIVDFYLQNTKYINNWDLVDSSAYKILGAYAFQYDKDSILEVLSNSKDLWEIRIAIVATLFHIKKENYALAKAIVAHNLLHQHDLIHKANGWMLREMGKKNGDELQDFLKLHYKVMPRTTLRYAIERMDEVVRQQYLKGEV